MSKHKQPKALTDGLLEEKSLADLNDFHTRVTARLTEFIDAGNFEQSVTYARIQTEIAVQIQRVIATKLEELKLAAKAQLAQLMEVKQ